MPEPLFVDDGTVADDEYVLRRIPKGQYVRDPKAAHGMRPNSGAFDDSSDGSPVSLSLASHYPDPASLIGDLPTAGVVAIAVRDLRTLGQGIVRDPTNDDPGHVLVFGPKPRSVGNKIAKAATWVVLPS